MARKIAKKLKNANFHVVPSDEKDVDKNNL